MSPIGVLETCFPEKFGIPRQPRLAPSAAGKIILEPPFNHSDCFEGLEHYSHIWLTFIFHENVKQGWKPKVRPPRLGGNKKMGVFATRSSFRPNGLGQSVVCLENIDVVDQKATIHVSGVDLVSGTPILDIKPYIPYADCLTQATSKFAEKPPEPLKVVFSEEANTFLRHSDEGDDYRVLIQDVLQQDPRPAYHDTQKGRVYRMTLNGMDVDWSISHQNDQQVLVISICKI